MAAAPTSTPARVDPDNAGDLCANAARLDPAPISSSIAGPESLRPMVRDVGEPTAISEHMADLLAALEHSEIDEARVAQVAALIEVASALEDVVTAKGGAGLGSIVKVADRAGRTSEYELIARPDLQRRRGKRCPSPRESGERSSVSGRETTSTSRCPTGVNAASR